MAYLSFTRNFEDVIINRVFSNIPQGFYIDVGGYQPISDSNTCALYQRGWRGIIIEPQAKMTPLWEKHRPEDIFINAAVGEANGTVIFNEFPWNDQAATIATNIVEMHRKEGREVRSYPVQQHTLTSLLEKHRPEGEIHLLSIDVEGAEKSVLNGLDRVKYRPWLIMLESTLPNRPKHNFNEWEPLLLDTGYKFAYFDAVNRFYLADEHTDLMHHFSYPPCVWDNFIDHRLFHAQQVAQKLQDELIALKGKLRSLSE